MKITVDGNTAAARIAYAFSEIASIYPITPSSTMAELADEWRAKGVKNLFGETLKVTQMQSEAGVAGAVHGSLVAGALTTTFTASQGLLLMIPNMYKIAGELLPTVFHVSARALSTHALSIFGDHSDVMACRSTGFSMLASNNVQEAQDMAIVAHLASLKSSVPFMHFFDGFRTSHEIHKIEGISDKDLLKLLPKKEIKAFKERALTSFKPHQQGTAQNPDIYFQNREASNKFYQNVPNAVQDSLDELEKVTGRHYEMYQYYGDKDATDVIVVMCSAVETARQTALHLNKTTGSKFGVLSVRLFRPFATNLFINALPKTVKRIAVLDRTKESGADGEPLYKDVATAILSSGRTDVRVIGGRYGIGGKEFTPNMAKAVFDNLQGEMKNGFTIGINDDVTGTSLNYDKSFMIDNDAYACKFYGLGSDGTVSANKNSIKIIGNEKDIDAQGYFEYDSKKSGSMTISHLRFGYEDKNTNIEAPYLINKAKFIACHNISFVGKYNMEDDLENNGYFLLNSPFDKEEVLRRLPQKFFKTLQEKNAKLYIVNANEIAERVGLGNKINVIMQTCFFKITGIIEFERVKKLLMDAAAKTYARKGQAIVDANINAIEEADKGLCNVDISKLSLSKLGSEYVEKELYETSKYYEEFINKIEHKEGDDLPVSKFNPHGIIPTNTARFEKRGVSIISPTWICENCIQCNMCATICPHGAIRPVLVTEEELKNAPESFKTKPAIGVKGKYYRMQINVDDCTGCGNCVNVCPALKKALKMEPTVENAIKEKINYQFAKKFDELKEPTIFNKFTQKGSQFEKPMFEFSGACAGCGETPYIKLLTQLFGKQLVIANATGCSSIYSGSAPTSPFAVNKDGRGPAWASSLFEDNAEFGYGIKLAQKLNRERLLKLTTEYLTNHKGENTEFITLLTSLKENFNDLDKTYELSKQLAPHFKGTEFEGLESALTKESTWIIGGDGWAYDIGFGGLDQVIASGENVNILVLDTEVYSNTGGQMSKSTPKSATAKFASDGKTTPKKDLGMIAMSYKNVYVAQIGLGADMNQTVKAFKEAESYDGPSLIIAYAPCINHGINMSKSQEEIKRAVQCGYWNLYRYDPRRIQENQNPFMLDSKEPSANYEDFLKGEARYRALEKISPSLAKELFERNRSDAMARYKKYLALSKAEITE